MSRALVLNASFEPLSVVSARRATVLVLADKAAMLATSGMTMRSERLEVEVPSVVRLHRYRRVPYGRRAALNRRTLFARDGHECQYCAGPAESIDHVIPRSRGGAHAWDNVVAACQACNTRKGDRLLTETSMQLRRQPVTPRGTAWVAISVGSVPDPWVPFLDADAAQLSA